MFGLSTVELALGAAVLVLAVLVVFLVFLALHSHRRAETAVRAQRDATQPKQPPIVVDLPVGMPLRLDREGGMSYTMRVGNDVEVRGLGYDQIARLAVSFLEAYVPSGGMLGRLTEWRLRRVAPGPDGEPPRRRRRGQVIADQLRDLSDENARLQVEVRLLERIIALRADVSSAPEAGADPDGELAAGGWAVEETLEMRRDAGPKLSTAPADPPPTPEA